MANKSNLEIVFKELVKKNPRKVCLLKNCIDFERKLQTDLNENVIEFCFGMSKQTIADEAGK